MKKSLVVLLIAVLALTSAFAAISGSASAKYVFDLDDKTATYTALADITADFSAKKTISLSAKGEGFPYVEAAVEATVKYSSYEDVTDGWPATLTWNLKTFKIVGEGEEWTLDLIANFANKDYAVSKIAVKEVKPQDKNGLYSYDYVWQTEPNTILVPVTYQWGAFPTTAPKAISYAKKGVGSITVIADMAAAVDAVEATKSIALITAATDKTYQVETYETLTYAQWVAITTATNIAESAEAIIPVEPTSATDVILAKVTRLYTLKTNDDAEDAIDATTTFAVELESEEVELTDALKAQAAFGLYSTKKTGTTTTNVGIGVSAKAAYEDAVKIAADFGWDGKKLSSDVAFQAKYGAFTLDTYYANGKLMVENPNKKTAATTPYVDAKVKTGRFDAKLEAYVEDIDTTFTVTGKDILSTATNAFNFAVETKYFNNFTLTASVSDVLREVTRTFAFGVVADFAEEYYTTVTANLSNVTAALKPVLALSAKYDNGVVEIDAAYAYNFDKPTLPMFALTASYDAAAYELEGGLKLNSKAAATNQILKGLYANAGISTTTLVNGATLALNYESGELSGKAVPAVEAKLGTITASCTVEF